MVGYLLCNKAGDVFVYACIDFKNPRIKKKKTNGSDYHQRVGVRNAGVCARLLWAYLFYSMLNFESCKCNT